MKTASVWKRYSFSKIGLLFSFDDRLTMNDLQRKVIGRYEDHDLAKQGKDAEHPSVDRWLAHRREDDLNDDAGKDEQEVRPLSDIAK